jgi:CheY-like chemotaxis protein/anti-sigma regulatory factor (Ser/Thr protein kinase)
MSKVLIVDDDRAARHLLRKVLAGAGHTVAVAGDGKKALEQIRARRFDVMLLDLWMPRMTGLDLLARIRTRKTRPRVIVMTSDDTPATLLRAVREEAAEYVRKPVDPAALLSLVKKVLERPASRPIEVVSARRDWVELVVPCTRDAVERVHGVIVHLDSDLPADARESIAYAFRELLMNAVEWGGRLDPNRTVRISYLRARRMVLYRIADPGTGFKIEDLDHAAITHPDDPVEHVAIRDKKGLRPGGFGLVTVQASVDELIYNEKRNEVVFIKYLDAEAPSGTAQPS